MSRNAVLALASVASFMASLDASIVNVAIPAISKAFAASFTAIIFIPTVYLLALAIFQPVFGRMGDRRGMRRVFISGLVVFTVGSFFSGLSGGVVELLAFRIVQGAGGAAMVATSLALIVNAYPVAERGRMVGINLGFVYGGLAMGPPIGGFLVQLLGWRSIFYVNVPIGVAAVALASAYLAKETASRSSFGFDLEGTLALAVFLSAGLVLLSGAAPGAAATALMAVVCVAAFVAFVYLERRARSPLLDLSLFTHNRLFAAGNATSLMNYLTSAGTLLLISIYLQLILGYSPVEAGLVLLAQPLVMAVTAVAAGDLSDRFSARILSSLGMVLRVLAFFLLSLLGLRSSELEILLPFMLLGAGHALFSSPNTNSVMSSVPASQLGIASGAMGTVRSAAQSLGVAVMGGVVAAALPVGAFAALNEGTAIVSGNIGQLYVLGMQRAFLLAAGISAAGIVTSLVRGKEARPSHGPAGSS
ncbi:MAG: MFS transporter [Nitrososphaerales archaeon]